MGALVCDICGGKLVIGAGGIATCESCGTEYSPERVKEKAMEIRGTVSIDNSNMINNWIALADKAFESNNFQEAYDYYTKVLETDPQNWKATLSRMAVSFYKEDVPNPRYLDFYNTVKNTYDLIIQSDMNPDDKTSAIKYVVTNGCRIGERAAGYYLDTTGYTVDYFIDKWKEVHETTPKICIKTLEEILDLLDSLDNTEDFKDSIIDIKKTICALLRCMCQNCICYGINYKDHVVVGLLASEKKEYVSKYNFYLAEIRETDPEYARNKYSQIDAWDPPQEFDKNRYDKMLNYWQKHEEEVKQQRLAEIEKRKRDEYWGAHPEEKADYDEKLTTLQNEFDSQNIKLSEIVNQITELQSKSRENNLSAIQQQHQGVLEQLDSISAEISSLGIFRGKQKKALQEEYDVLIKSQAELHNQLVDAQGIEEDIQMKMTELQSQKNLYEDKITEINNKITQIQNAINNPDY
ncbi:hypothetical protein SAMN02745229_03920 [Butyrivibrio fibrisolvens DSM 3071]|uniref:Uncharacterized protein n=1 Tax=Butyrivibrio fibrisolvens DSM 3071 TaxID=1121131 RepID=A0A1M6FI93_BUTFI|nr:hypothetical protein [Butyrivibrio fibrisolvens]SHI97349.1 hypothetical protein SAMN02745229_03920 [Butyrivibrio fibrisolvens DSM 3071]